MSTAIDSRDRVGEIDEAIHVLRALEPLVAVHGTLDELENRPLAGKLTFKQLVFLMRIGGAIGDALAVA